MAKVFRFNNNFIGTVEDYILTYKLESIEKIVQTDGMSGYNRRLFNRKNHAEQLEYITKLFKKRTHQVWLDDGIIYDVPKKFFDTLWDIYTDAHLFGGEGNTPFDVNLNYDEDYEAAAKAWLKY